jgi:hemerythrin-like domain-containing protein
VKATETLKHEHDVILQALALLDALATRVAGDDLPVPGDVGGVLEFFTVFADGCHHVKEETILFPALEAAGLARDAGPIGMLLEQHEQGRRFVGSLRRELPALERDAPARRRFAAGAREYVAMLERHIEMENQGLFAIADRLLTEEQDREISAAFDRHEAVAMGPDVHRRFHEMLDLLKKKYR